MAPSPELGQPKAPDKTTAAPTSSSATGSDSTSHHDNYLKSNASNDFNLNNDSKMYNIDDNCHSTKISTVIDATPAATTSAPANSCNSTGASSQSAAPSSNSLNSTNLKNWDDCNFQSLLDEAYRYRSPKDRENKSETFLQLLQTAESKEEESEYLIRTLSTGYTQGPNRHKHGGSLQDLDKTAHNEVSLDVYGNRCHQHHHNSRPKKYSSVSSRQREGGSLPSNVNVSNCNLSICEQSFLNEDSSKRRGKNERTCSGTSCASGTSGTSSTVSTGHDSFSSGQIKDDTYTNSSAHTIIDMNETFADDSQHLVAHDSLAQGIPEPMDCDEGTELSTLKKFSSRSGGKVPGSEQKHFVDESVTFSSLERGKNIEATYLHFDENYKACKSIMGNKTDEENKQSLSTSRTSTHKNCDENGNSLNSPYNSSQSSQVKAKKKKQPQSERNMTTLNPKACAGYRGYDTVEELLRFIENTDTKKDKMKSKKKEKTREKDKDKDKEKGDKEVQHKMKKCNSLEELRSCTKFDDDEKSESQVTMRNKGKKPSTGGSSSAINDGKETLKQHNKRGERRSWGTEELTYLGENHAIEEVREKAKEKEKKEKNKLKDNVEKHDKVEKLEKLEKQEKSEKIESNKKKKDDFNFSSTSLLADTFQSESAEFHVVTKKKKAKKRQQMDESRSVKNVSIKDTGNLSSAQGHKKFQSSNFTNDRELYLNSLNTNEPRRKSTSSVPPSEKSDSSDLDSVHSLPIESTSNRHTSGSLSTSVTAAANVAASATLTAATVNSTPQIQHQSYADIARTVNSGKPFNLLTSPPMDKMDKWPSVSTNYSSSGNSTGSSASSLQQSNGNDLQISINKQKKSLSKNFSNFGNDKANNNDSSSSSSISSNSTIVKQISYSQSLGDEKCSGSSNSSTKSSTSTSVSQQRLTDVIRLSDSKQTLQKSKSFENDNYYSNMDQYPALEKTVKRHATHSTIFDPRSSSQVSLNPLQFQSRSVTLTQNLSQPTVTGITGDVKSKGVTVNSGDGTNLAGIALPSASLLNPGSSSGSKKSKQQHHQLVQQPQQQLNAAKIVYTENPQIVSPPAIDVTSSKNKQQGTVQAPVQLGQGSIVEQSSSNTSSINVNIVKKSKSEVYSPQQQPQQQQISTVTTNPQGRKTKKDKNNQSSCSVGSSDSVMTTSSMYVANNINSSSKISNRPAVIILNDANDTSLSIANDFTFGDFNEEELRLFDNNQPIHQQQSLQLDDSGQYSFNQNVPDVNLIQNEASIRQYDDPLHLSPHSDQGYSSSNNRSMLSESSDSSLCTKIDGEYVSTQIFPTISESCNMSPDNVCNKRQMHNIKIGSATESTSSPLSTVPNNATNLGTNFASGKIDLSCNRNSINNYSEISLDPCIIAVNSVDITAAKRNLIYNVENSVQQQQQTQQLMNQILVNSGSASSTSTSNKNNTNCNISNVMSGMSSNNDKLSSLMLSHKKCANNNVSSDVTTTAPTGNVVNQQTSDTKKIIFDADSTNPTNTSEDNEFTACWDSQNSKGINIRFVAPPPSIEMSLVNIEKMVDFVSLAWEEILHGANRGTQFYNGQ